MRHVCLLRQLYYCQTYSCLLALVLRIPTLAIHLDRQEKFEFNKETQLFPIAGMVAAELDRQVKSTSDLKRDSANADEENISFSSLKPMTERHHPYLIELIAKEVGVSADEVMDFELILYDTQVSSLRLTKAFMTLLFHYIELVNSISLNIFYHFLCSQNILRCVRELAKLTHMIESMYRWYQ